MNKNINKNKLLIILLIAIALSVYITFKPKEIAKLPQSFTMEVLGNFSDQTLYNKPGGEAGSAFMLSSGKEELEGEVQYTYAEGDGYLILCGIKNNKWVTNDSVPRECHSLAKLPTTRTELIKKISTGELKQRSCESYKKYDFCYEFK
ncbi:MAG: hypothetical protein KBD12_02750 [Candidatus Pacebacteria bacterium]|nr:hypothetical protein [Candidatus Paceibacterota bacterium]